jgi:hypothetical protein
VQALQEPAYRLSRFHRVHDGNVLIKCLATFTTKALNWIVTPSTLPSFGPAIRQPRIFSSRGCNARLEVDPMHSALMVWQLPTFANVQSVIRVVLTI